MKVLFVISELRGANKFSPFVMALASMLEKVGIEIDYFELLGHGVKKYLKGIVNLNKHLRKNKYDLIHAHYNYSAYCATFQNKAPLIVSFLGSDLLAKRQRLSKYLNNYINRRLFKKAQGFICKTDEMDKYLPIQLNKVVISNGVDLSVFNKISQAEAIQKLGLNKERKYVLFPANPVRVEKNYNLCLETIDLVKKENSDVELLTVHNVKQSDLQLYYNAAYVLLVTSTYEGGINVVKEAMACNCPIVTTNVGDVEARLKNVENSHVCNSEPLELSKKILEIISNGFRSNGREQILIQKQDAVQVAGRVVEFYKRIVYNK